MFQRSNPLLGKSLWKLSQGKQTVGEFFTEVVSQDQSAFLDMPEEYRDKLLTNVFVAGLNESYQRDILLKDELTLQQTLEEAKKLEAVDGALKTQKINLIESEIVAEVNYTRSQVDLIAPLQKQIDGLAELIKAQSIRSKEQAERSYRSNNYQPNRYRGRGCGNNRGNRRGRYT